MCGSCVYCVMDANVMCSSVIWHTAVYIKHLMINYILNNNSHHKLSYDREVERCIHNYVACFGSHVHTYIRMHIANVMYVRICYDCITTVQLNLNLTFKYK